MSDLIENNANENLDNDATKDLYLCFEVDDENYAIDIIHVKEIITMTDITPVPESPNYVRGIINLRGDIAPVICVRSRFNKENKPYDEMTCIIVLRTSDIIIGLVVDSVSGSITITEDNIIAAPSANLKQSSQFVRNIGKTNVGVKLLIDVEKLLFN